MSGTRDFFMGHELKGLLGILRIKEIDRITHNEMSSGLIADRFTFLTLGEVIGAGTRRSAIWRRCWSAPEPRRQTGCKPLKTRAVTVMATSRYSCMAWQAWNRAFSEREQCSPKPPRSCPVKSGKRNL
jgi:hypothetical protein